MLWANLGVELGSTIFSIDIRESFIDPYWCVSMLGVQGNVMFHVGWGNELWPPYMDLGDSPSWANFGG